MLRIVTLLFGLFVLSLGPALSATFYIAPLETKLTGTPDGSEKLPFLSIDAALKTGKVKGGDTLLLKDGAYGAVTIKANAAFDKPVTITSQNKKAAQFDSILLAGTTRNLTLKNLSVWPRDPAKGALYLIRSYTTTSEITLDGLDIRSELDAAGYMGWNKAKWEARKYSGIMLQSPRSLVTNSKLTGVRHGIMVSDDSQIIGNVIEGYNGDGMRAFSRSTVRNNRIINCVQTDGNHADGFQSFSQDGAPVTGLVVEGNTILEWTGANTHALRCSLQGIGLFDGFYDDLTISNNLVSTSQYHGISVYGARRAKIINNTVVNAKGLTGVYPYISVRPVRASKGGHPSTDVLVANNVAMSFQGTASAADRVVFLSNSVVGTPSVMFENPAAFDYRPKKTSGLIDTADAKAAPPADLMGVKRPSGKAPDRGAYELSGASAAPAETVTAVPSARAAAAGAAVVTTLPDGTTMQDSKVGSVMITTITSPDGAKRIVLSANQ